VWRTHGAKNKAEPGGIAALPPRTPPQNPNLHPRLRGALLAKIGLILGPHWQLYFTLK